MQLVTVTLDPGQLPIAVRSFLEIVQFVAIRVELPTISIPWLPFAEMTQSVIDIVFRRRTPVLSFREIVQPVRVAAPVIALLELPINLQPVSTGLPPQLYMPPACTAEFPVKVQSTSVGALFPVAFMACRSLLWCPSAMVAQSQELRQFAPWCIPAGMSALPLIASALPLTADILGEVGNVSRW